MTKNKPIRALLLCSTLAAVPAFAQHGWYGGLSAGQSTTDSSLVSNREATITNAADIRTNFDDKDNAWKAMVGYRILPWLSLEANYADYGSTKMDTTFTVPGGATGFGGVVVDRKVKGFGVDAVLSAPVMGERLSVFGRIGAVRVETKADATLSGDTFFTDGEPGNTRSNKSKETVTRFGVGLDYAFTPKIAARLEWERLTDVGRKFEGGVTGTTGEADLDMWSLGVVFRF